jgi:hypothetical protein
MPTQYRLHRRPEALKTIQSSSVQSSSSDILLYCFLYITDTVIFLRC